MSTPTRDDVWFCIHLYEQRREPVLREAREWLSSFCPRSFKDVRAVMEGKDLEANRYWRQATSYWEMIAGLLLSGGLTPECVQLFTQTTKEWFFHWSKVAPFIDEIRAFARPTTLRNLEMLCRSVPDYDDMMGYFTQMNERIAASGKKKAKKGGKKTTKKATRKAAAKKATKKATRRR